MPIVRNAIDCWHSRRGSNRGVGRSKVRPAPARCWPNNSSPPARPCSMCRRRSRHGCGSSTTPAATRPTPTTPAPRRSSRCATHDCGWSVSRTTRRCCASSPNVTTTWSRIAPGRSVASTPCLCQLAAGGLPETFPPPEPPPSCVASEPTDAVGVERRRLAVELLGEVRRTDTDLVELKARIAASVEPCGDDGHRRGGCRPDHGRVSHRLQRRRVSLPHRRPLRPLQRHRTHRSVVGTQRAASTQPPRQPPVEPRAPHRRGHPGPQRHARTRLLPAQTSRRQDQAKKRCAH